MQKSEVCKEFTFHPLRKECRKCKNAKAEHPLFEEDVEHMRKFIKVFKDLPEVTPNIIYAWTPPYCPINRVDEYFKKFPEDKVPRHGSEGQKNRLKRLTIQIPLSDISVENCRFVEDDTKTSLEQFIEKMQNNSLAVGFVKEFAKEMPIQCPKCLLILEPGELVVVSSDRDGPSYHPICFVCFRCEDVLADLIHCSDIDGTVFCVRHFAENSKKRCHSCDELIFSSRYAMAGDKFYHREHLLCYECDHLLKSNKGYDKAGELYCGSCYEKMFCKDCTKCSNRITLESRHISYLDGNWHYDCFTCSKCEKVLADNPFEIVDEKFLCIDCYNAAYAPKCEGCGLVFEAQAKVVKYEEKNYHVPCFKCCDCEESIGIGSFVPHKQRVYCKPCHLRNFGVRCFRCKYAITDDRGVMYNKQPYHVDCFICYQCSTKISSRPFKTVNDNWYCMNCYGDTFCKKCNVCEEPILLGAQEDVLYSYEDFRWHAGCFCCSVCTKSLADTPFLMTDKLLMCKGCVQERNSNSQDKVAMESRTQEQEEQTAVPNSPESTLS